MTLILKRYISPYKILPRLLPSFIWGLSKGIRIWRAAARSIQFTKSLTNKGGGWTGTHCWELLMCVSKSPLCLNRFGSNTEIQTIFDYTGSQLEQAWGYTRHDRDWGLVGNQPTLIKGINAELLYLDQEGKFKIPLVRNHEEKIAACPNTFPLKRGYFLLRGVCQLVNIHMCMST